MKAALLCIILALAGCDGGSIYKSGGGCQSSVENGCCSASDFDNSRRLCDGDHLLQCVQLVENSNADGYFWKLLQACAVKHPGEPACLSGACQ